MSFGKSDINVKIGATDKTAAAFSSAEKRMKLLSGSAKMLTTTMSGVFGVYGGAMLFSTGIKSAIEFDKAIRNVNSLLNLSGADFKNLRKEIEDLSVSLGVDAVDAANAAYQAISAGVSRKDLSGFLTTATKAGIAGVSDVETSVDGLTNALNAYGKNAAEAGKMADTMFAAVVEGKTTFGELADSMYLAAPMASVLGVSFEELMASVAAITKRGAPTSAAFTQIRSALVAMQKPTAEMTKVINSLGFSSADAMIKAEGYEGSLASLREQSEKLGISLSSVFGRVEAQNAVFNLTGDAANEYKRILDSTTDSSGKMAAAFDENNQSIMRSVEELNASFKGLFNMDVKSSPLAYGLKNFILDPLTEIMKMMSGNSSAAEDIFSAILFPNSDIRKKIENLEFQLQGLINTKNLLSSGPLAASFDTSNIDAQIERLTVQLNNLKGIKAEMDAAASGPPDIVISGSTTVPKSIIPDGTIAETQSDLDDLKKLFDSASDNLVAKQQNALEQWTNSNLTKQQMLVHAMENTSDSMTDAFMDFCTTGKANFADFADSILQDIARMTFQQGVANPFTQWISGGLANMFTGGTSTETVSGTRASGGAVSAGRSYLVGEQGPEIMTTRSNGTVIPNDQIGGSTVIQFTVNAVDSASFSSHLAKHKKEISGIVEQAYNRRGRRGPLTS